MKTFKYIRQTGEGGSDQLAQKVIGTTTSKHVAQEVDELVYRRLNTKIESSTNSQPVQIISSNTARLRVGSRFASSREACRIMGVSSQALAQAFYRSKKKTATINGVTFKRCSRL